MRPPDSLRWAVAALVTMSLIWGYNWVVMKKVLRFVDPFDFSAIRALCGALLLFGVLILLRKPVRPVAVGPTIVLGLLQTAAFTALVQWALVNGGAGKTAVLVYVMPFWLLPMAWLLLGERIRGLQWVAIALAGLGLVFILEPWAAQANLFSSALALAGSFIWASSAIVAKRLRQKFEVDLLSLTAWQMLFGAIVLGVVALILPSQPIVMNAYFWGALVFNALFATALAWLLWLYILNRLPAGIAGLSSLSVPAIGVLAAWIQLGERPSGAEAIGMALVAVALGLISLLAMRARSVQSRG